MIKASVSLQELRRKIYIKAKADKQWRFWGLYGHITKPEVLQEAYRLAKANNGAPGIDGKSFEDVEQEGLEGFLEGIRQELLERTYRPRPNRRVEIPKGNGKTRLLGIPTIKDRVVQGALKLILEPIFEADFKGCSYGYRPRRSAHQAVDRVTGGILRGLTRVVDVDLSGYFDNIRHHLLLEKVGRRVQDDEVMHLLKLILKANGKKGVPQGGVISPLLSNLYLNAVDEMMERAREVTRRKGYENMDFVRSADDMVISGSWAPQRGLASAGSPETAEGGVGEAPGADERGEDHGGEPQGGWMFQFSGVRLPAQPESDGADLRQQDSPEEEAQGDRREGEGRTQGQLEPAAWGGDPGGERSGARLGQLFPDWQ